MHLNGAKLWRARHPSEMPSVMEEDGLGPARGVILALLLVTPVWVAFIGWLCGWW